MNNKLKSGLYFGLGIAFIFLIKDSFSWLTGEVSTSEIIKSLISSILAGLFTGIIVAWLADKFLTSSIFTKPPKFNFENEEVIHFQTPANHFKGIEAVGGFLCLTNKRLLFKSHNLNIQNHELSIILSDITTVDRYKTLGIINNGLAIRLSNDETEKFVVDKAKQWIENIGMTKNGLQHGISAIAADK